MSSKPTARSSSWQWYSASLVKRPLATKMVSAACLLGTADIIRQKYEHSLKVKAAGLDNNSKALPWLSLRRTATLSSWYAMVHAPWVHVWFGWLDRFYGAAVTPRAVILKTLTDQAFSMPVILFGMLLYSGLMSNLSFDSAWDRARRNHVETMQGAVITWVPALAINFALVPAKYRLLFINFVQIGFGVFVSRMANQE